MAKNIYELLNEVETDFTEYEAVVLSEEEKSRHKQDILQEVKHMRNKNNQTRKHINAGKKAAGAAAACALVITAAGAANPALAKGLFSDVFGQLIENAQGGKYEQEDTERYTEIGRHAVDIQEEVTKQETDDGYTTTAENNGVTVSISDVYCDGYMLYYTATLQTDNKALLQADGILSSRDTQNGEDVQIKGMDMSGYASTAFNKSKDGTFVSANEVSLLSGGYVGSDSADTIILDWSLQDLSGYLYDQWDDQGEYAKTGTVDGEWHLRFPVTIDTSKNQSYKLGKEENGIQVKRATKTKAGLVVEIIFPGQEILDNTDMGIQDAQGNWLQWLGQKSADLEDGSVACQIMVLYDGQKDLTFKLNRKDADGTVLADIPFQIPQTE